MVEKLLWGVCERRPYWWEHPDVEGKSSMQEKQLVHRPRGKSEVPQIDLSLWPTGIKLWEAQVWQDGMKTDLESEPWVRVWILISVCPSRKGGHQYLLHRVAAKTIYQWQGHSLYSVPLNCWPRKVLVFASSNAGASHHQEAQGSLGNNIREIRAKAIVPQKPTPKEKWEQCCLV